MSCFYARLHQRFGTPTPPALRSRAEDRLQSLHNLTAVKAVNGLADHLATGKAIVPSKLATRPSIAVIGAGFSGLMAGSLLAKSCNVRVFEARDRIGGRVWTDVDKVRHRAIEKGAELIGYNHTIWLTLAKRFNLGLTVLTTEDAFDALGLDMPFYLNGSRVTDEEAKKIYEEMDAANKQMIQDAKPMADPNKPWEMPNAHRLDNLSVGHWINRQSCSDLTKVAMATDLANTNGAPVDRQSYLGLLAAIKGGALKHEPDAYFTKSETVKCEQGNDTLAKRLAEEIHGPHSSVETSTPIKHVEIKANLVRLTKANGQTVDFDYVVLAIPPSLWSGGHIKIDPPIPDNYRMTMGSAVKYLSKMDSRFWFGENLSPTSSSTDIGVTWEGTDNQVQLDGQSVALSLFAGGTAAETAMRFSSDDERNEFYRDKLGTVYPGYANQLLSTEFVCWPKDDWTKAGYSCPAPGDVTRIGPFLDRRYNDRLYFAGEHCCPAFYGYMEGALQSGAATAATIMRDVGVQ